MPYRNKQFDKYFFYHIYNRAIDKLFYSNEKYSYCLNLIQKYSKKYNIPIIAYCLMPNHYHLLVKQESSDSIGKFMQVLFKFNAYVQGLNKQLNRKGPLFEGRFKHIKIVRQEYLLHLCRYIHLNPTKAGLVKMPEDWKYSNYLEWIGKRNGRLVDYDFISSYFKIPKDYINFVLDHQSELKYQNRLQKYILE